MNYYIEYTPGNKELNQAERMSMVGSTPKDARIGILELANGILGDVIKKLEPRGEFPEDFHEISDSDRVDSIVHGDPNDLPVDFLQRVNRFVAVVDGLTGLQMWVDKTDPDQPNYEILLEEAYPNISDDPHYQAVAEHPDFTHTATQLQLTADEVMEHHSVGYLNEDGKYEPRLTILNPDHPARQDGNVHLLKAA